MAYSYPYSPYYYRNYNNYSSSRFNIPYYNEPYSKMNNVNLNSVNSAEKESIRITSEKDNTEDEDREFINIFGLTLYYDDILLICLLFFLYNEGVKDQYLFISLILLLLS